MSWSCVPLDAEPVVLTAKRSTQELYILDMISGDALDEYFRGVLLENKTVVQCFSFPKET